MVQLRADIIKMIQKNRRNIHNLGVRRLGLFGSCARNQATSKSDLDFIVDFKKKSFDSYMELKFFLEDLFKTHVDLVLPNTLKPRLRKSILKNVTYVQGL